MGGMRKRITKYNGFDVKACFYSLNLFVLFGWIARKIKYPFNLWRIDDPFDDFRM
jgi:hypothetical protein